MREALPDDETACWFQGALRAIGPLNLFQTQYLFTPKIAGLLSCPESDEAAHACWNACDDGVALNFNAGITRLMPTLVPGANITLYYHGAFCYLMMRRYLDAARAFNTILAYIARVKQFHQRSAQ